MDGHPHMQATPPTDACIFEAAKRFDLPPRLIYTILKVEGGKAGKVSSNKNGTFDMGPMQINSIWLNTFAGYVSPHELLYNGCVNVLAGAWLLRSHINAAGDFWTGVGNYHSKTPHFHKRYVQKVYSTSQVVRPLNVATARSERR